MWVNYGSQKRSGAHEIVAQTFKGNRNKNPQRKTNQTERNKSEIKPKDWPLYGQSLEYPHQSIGCFYVALHNIECSYKPKSAYSRNLYFNKSIQ